MPRDHSVHTEIIVNASPSETRIAIMEDHRLVEFFAERADSARQVGDLYKGRVNAVLPGMQAAFIDNPRVTTISIHESGNTLFPGTGFETEIGEGDGRGHCINLPLPVGTYDGVYYKAFSETVLPIAKRLDPDVIVLELGMDGLAVDPLAHLNLTNNVYADMEADIVELEKPILAVGGGGYNPAKTVRAWALAWSRKTSTEEDSTDGARSKKVQVPLVGESLVCDATFDLHLHRACSAVAGGRDALQRIA